MIAELQFAGGQRGREVRLPDASTRPRIRFLREIALAWHLVHEWSRKEPQRPFWAASYARHLCRSNPGCTRVKLFVRLHQMPDPAAVIEAASRGKAPDLEPEDFGFQQPIGAFSCDEL